MILEEGVVSPEQTGGPAGRLERMLGPGAGWRAVIAVVPKSGFSNPTVPADARGLITVQIPIGRPGMRLRFRVCNKPPGAGMAQATQQWSTEVPKAIYLADDSAQVLV